MDELPSIEKLADSFSKLPGVGARTAERMAYAILEMDEEDVMAFSSNLKDVKTKISRCPTCGLYVESGRCSVCEDAGRDHSSCIVVSQPKDAISFEKLKGFNGVYHVIGGLIAPSKGIGPADLNIDKLLERVQTEGINEIVVATSSTIEGETTALYLAKILEGLPVTVTRLGYGLPIGANLEYADAATLEKALEGRRKL